ncbi:hypothetical protein V1512DRAFT_254271 [Lipomyces arxii]|uniref:uncharacterized protein n=1 Tax=Lipomyces arxii TaxID=56418 RepID=UPI0034CECCC9
MQISQTKRSSGVMDLRAILNSVDGDIVPGRPSAMHKRTHHHSIKQSNVVETNVDLLIDRNNLIKDLRRNLRDTNSRISNRKKELSGLKLAHGEVLEKFELVGDDTRMLLKSKALLETQTKQVEKRADKAGKEEARLNALLEKLSLKNSDAEQTLKDKNDSKDNEISAETEKLGKLVIKLEHENESLTVQVDQKSLEAEDMRMQYQKESARAAELCQEVLQLKETQAELEKISAGDSVRAMSALRTVELALLDEQIQALKCQIANLEDVLGRLESEEKRRMAKYESRPTNSFVRRTRSPATSSLSRGCSPASLPNGSGQISHGSNSSGGHPLQYSQKV